MLCLLEHGYYVTIIDNLDNAFEEAYRCASSTMKSKLLHMQGLGAFKDHLESSLIYFFILINTMSCATGACRRWLVTGPTG